MTINLSRRCVLCACFFVLGGCTSRPVIKQPVDNFEAADTSIDHCFSLVDSGRYKEAVAVCGVASDAHPDSFIAQAAYAKALAETGERVLAVEYYRSALEIDPAAIMTRMELAMLHKDAGNFEFALIEYQKISEYQPDYLNAIVEEAQIHKIQSNWIAAAEKYRKAVQLQSGDEYLRIDFLQAMVRAGKKAEFREAKELALKDFPESVSLLKSLASLLVEQKQYGEAITCYQKVLRIDMKDDLISYNLALCYFKDGQIPSSRRYLGDYLSKHPDSSPGHLLAGQIALESGDLGAAEKAIRSAIEYDQRNGSAYVFLGNILQKTDDREGAKEAYREALRINPDDAIAKRNLKRLY